MHKNCTRKFLGLVATTAIAFTMIVDVCSAKAIAADEIAFLPMTLDNEFFVAMKNGAEEKCKELGYTLITQSGSGHSSASEQLQLMENMIQKEVKAIMMCPCSSTGLISGIKKANAANIPVIILDAQVDQARLTEEGGHTEAYIGSDNYRGGAVAGEYVKKLATDIGRTLKTVILTGVPGQESVDLRRDGFLDAAGESGTVVALQNADYEFSKANDVMTNILTANDDIDLLYACNDLMALGAYRAARQAGRKDIITIGFDGNSDALDSIINGELAGTVAQLPAEMGIMGVVAADKLIKGQTVEKTTFTDIKVVDKSNVADFVEYVNKYSGN